MQERIKGGVVVLLLAVLAGGCTFYHSVGKSAGAYVRTVSGSDFEPVSSDEWNQREHALIYFYRPQSQWANDELWAPSVYLDDTHYFNLRSNGYTWLEVYPGERRIDMRRPFIGLEALGGTFDHIVETTLTVEAGETYYIRYSEVDEPESVHDSLENEHPLANTDARLVDSATALPELRETHFLDSQLLALNNAGGSIVRDNLTTDFDQREAQLEERREAEIEALKRQGHYEPPPWYWPFGQGQPTKPLETDAELQALASQRESYLADCCQWGVWKRQCDQPDQPCQIQD